MLPYISLPPYHDEEDEDDADLPVLLLDDDEEEHVEPWEDPNVEDIPEITDPEMPLPEGEPFETTIAYLDRPLAQFIEEQRALLPSVLS